MDNEPKTAGEVYAKYRALPPVRKFFATPFLILLHVVAICVFVPCVIYAFITGDSPLPDDTKPKE